MDKLQLLESLLRGQSELYCALQHQLRALSSCVCKLIEGRRLELDVRRVDLVWIHVNYRSPSEALALTGADDLVPNVKLLRPYGELMEYR